MSSTTLRTTIQSVGIVLSSLIIVTTSPVSATIPAHKCGSEYDASNYLPHSKEYNSDYYQIIPTRYDDSVIDQLRDFTDSFKGRWQGTGIDIRCFVSNKNIRVTVDNFDVDAEFNKQIQGRLIMNLEQENAEQVNLDRISLSPDTERDSALDQDELYKTHGQKTGHVSFLVDLSEPGTLVFDEKYRRAVARPNRLDRRTGLFVDPVSGDTVIKTFDGRPPAPFARQLVHEIKTVSLDESDLTISRDVYVNGRFVSQQQWQLKQR